MIYKIHPDWTTNWKTEVVPPTDLSQHDKDVISEMYPVNIKDTRHFNIDGITSTNSTLPL